MRPASGRIAVAAAALFMAGSLEARGQRTEHLVLSSDLRVSIRDGREIALEVKPARGQGYDDIASRVTGSAARGPAIESANRGAFPSAERFVTVPLRLLSDEYRSLILLNLFPRDRWDGEDWLHEVGSGVVPTYGEGLWQVAEWFTGDGDRFEEIRKANRLSSPEVERGATVRIPARLLHSSMRARPRSDDGSLVYDRDERGPYAGYRLRSGEALYSAVVVRYTGRMSAEDVESVARQLAPRSGIRDLQDIPAGFLVKIPLDLLEPEHLPRDHPRRKQAEALRAEVQAARPGAGPSTLDGVVIVLDPGHGGRDLGTMNNGIWEHDYVYDVACRLKRRLERSTAARVLMTLEDRETGCAPSVSDALRANHQGTILTNPPFLAREKGEAAVGVNLRWYLANSWYRRATAAGTDARRVVFLSLHADARHASLRGAMVYVPGVRYTGGVHGHLSRTYRRYKEVQEKPRVSHSRTARVRSEAVSRELADRVIDAFRAAELPVQTYKPVRERIIRGRRTWVPAVLRGNEIPAKVLVEMVNLANSKDAALLASVRGRERLAAALESGLLAYYGETPAAPPSRRVSR